MNIFQKDVHEKDRPDKLQYHETVTITWAECASRMERLSIENPTAFERAAKVFSRNIVCTKNDIGIGQCNGDSGHYTFFHPFFIFLHTPVQRKRILLRQENIFSFAFAFSIKIHFKDTVYFEFWIRRSTCCENR